MVYPYVGLAQPEPRGASLTTSAKAGSDQSGVARAVSSRFRYSLRAPERCDSAQRFLINGHPEIETAFRERLDPTASTAARHSGRFVAAHA